MQMFSIFIDFHYYYDVAKVVQICWPNWLFPINKLSQTNRLLFWMFIIWDKYCETELYFESEGKKIFIRLKINN